MTGARARRVSRGSRDLLDDGSASWRSRAVALATVALLAGGVLIPSASSADPGSSEDDLQAAHEALDSTAAAVAQIEVQLAQDNADLETAWTAVAAAAEDYTQALVDREAAVRAAAEAAQREAAAELDVDAARSELGDIALQAYRSGGSLDGLGVLLSADGFDDLIQRTAAMDRLGERAQRAVQRFEAVDLVARALGGRAADAGQAAEDTAVVAHDALEHAQDLQAQAEQKVAEVAAQREKLLAELTRRRGTTIEAERAHQAELDAARAARTNAAAAAERGVPANGPVADPVSAPAAPPVSSQPTTAPTAPGAPPATTTPAPTATPQPAPAPAPAPATAPAPAPAPDAYGLGTGSQRGSTEQGQAAVDWASQQVGKEYGLGRTGTDAYDCSGLTSQAWLAAGLGISRTSRDQYRQVRKITYDSMRPGDLIFYGSVGSDPGSITHVAMYVGPGTMVEAPRPGVAVRVTSIRWSGTMPFAGRP